MSNADNAVNAIQELKTELDPVETTTMDILMEAFTRICAKHGGKFFKILPTDFTLSAHKGEPAITFHVHAATFEGKKGQVAFAAVLFDKESSEFEGVHSKSPDWPQWLDIILRRIHDGTIEALRAHPGISTARH